MSTDPQQPNPETTDPTAPLPVPEAPPEAPADAPPAAPPADAPPPAAPDPGGVEDERAQLAAERAQLDAERAQLNAMRSQLAQGAVSPQAAAVDLASEDQGAREKRYSEWPADGGGDLPQPWDLRSLGLHSESRDLEQAGDAPNTVSPIVITHDRPILTSGSADQSVQDLGRRLKALGFETSVSRGENPFGRVDETIMGAIYAFRAAYGVEEDPSPFGGNTPAGRTLASSHIGPWTWEAVLRASDRALEAVS